MPGVSRKHHTSDGGNARGLGGEGRREPADVKLTVQVWDEDDLVAGDFLGELTFGTEELLEMARGGRMSVRYHQRERVGALQY